MKPREAAYRALVHYLHNQSPITDSLERWRKKGKPLAKDFSLAREIAYGTVRMARALDWFLLQLAERDRIKANHKERALLRMALYQHLFMDRIPLHAIVYEAVALAKRECNKSFAGFLNALLRKLPSTHLSLPEGDDTESLSIRYSYPLWFVEKLLHHYGKESAKEILAVENQAPPTTLRLRSQEIPEGVAIIEGLPWTLGRVVDTSAMNRLIASPEVYLQNYTPAVLMKTMAEYGSTPQRILDLCAAPGGKLLAAHDLYPEAELFANDLSQQKIKRLEENSKKYGISVHIREGLGEEYPENILFDRILLDVPCSNTGVLHKRPEARWRLGEEALVDLQEKQEQLLKHAVKLLHPKGQIWWMTCSILPEENEAMVVQAEREHGLHCLYSKTVLPNREGWDGGFGAILSKK